MKTILHISADFPDPIAPAKTKAVQWLLEAAPGFRHIVYSLNRASWRSGVVSVPFGDGHCALAYGAPPYGVGMAPRLSRLADFILADLEKRRLVPDLVHAHKFTVEGLIADRIGNKAQVPFIASLWGGTDCRIYTAKPNLRPAYRRIAHSAAALLPAAPWTASYFAEAFAMDTSAFQLLPIMTKADAILPPVHCAQPRLLSVFNYDCWKRKGFAILIAATSRLGKIIPDLALDVYGRGSAKSLLDMAALIEKSALSGRVRLMPPMEHGNMQAAMNQYAGFALPSRPETYGMVFAEAVLAGVPILWARNQGIDGMFDGMAVGYAADPTSVDDVAKGLLHLIERQEMLKRSIAELQASGALDMLRRSQIGGRYSELLERLASKSPSTVATAA